MKFYRKKNAAISEINIAPFTDVILVLLVIFMITTPALMQPGIKVNIPKAKIAADRQDNTNVTNIDILISKEGYVYIDGKQVNILDIENVLRRLISSKPDKVAVIKCDEEARYNCLVQTMVNAKKAGVTKFALSVDNTTK
ncbi:MAG: biopolymer transporter ExbD [Endomicrobium sp.]|jgi:biopolymer transport protein ExbD|nr:biopolymer transporter ExbD [Endomicrobium sp.]